MGESEVTREMHRFGASFLFFFKKRLDKPRVAW
nr:MAG TPA: hypothetical protein [Caudoviricetes sp.]